MNLLVSYDWLKEYVKLNATPEEFARKLSLSGPSVERIHRQGEGLKNVVVGRIVKVKPHPNADKLRIVETDLGTMTKDIICGGSNLAEGQLVAVALPGSWVKWHGQGEPVEIKETKLRGADSYGMICGADEIGLLDRFPKKEEKEIVDLSSTKAKPGMPLAVVFGLGGVVFDVEVTTNRPDAFSMVGMAREAAAIFGVPFTWKSHEKISAAKEEFHVEVKAPKLCPRYMTVAMKGAKVGESPAWLKECLAAAGHSSINNLVDITNYVMLELGQPMHVFDRAKLKGDKIVVREAKKGEKMQALDGKAYAFEDGQLVIADAERPVAVAGVMGGSETGVSAGTTDLVFEAATFDSVSVRRTARALGLHSDSSLRFEKGLSTEALPNALACAVILAQELCGAKVSSAVADTRTKPYKKVTLSFRPARANELIGVDIPAAKQKKTLTSLGFKVAGTGKSWNVEVPYWRDQDIEGERDLIEEVARVYGYGNLPSVIPDGPLPLVETPKELVWEDRVKRLLKDWGLTEAITYSFISGQMADASGFPKESLLRVSNPLTEDFEYMRPSLLSGMLKIVAENQEMRPEGSVFELSNVYFKKENDLPQEQPRLGIALWSAATDGSLVMKLKGLLEALAAELGLAISTTAIPGEGGAWHPGRCAEVTTGGAKLARLSELHPAYCAKFGIERRVAYLELMFDAAVTHASSAKRYLPIPTFPPVKRDVAFVVDRRRTHAEIAKALGNADAMIASVELFDVFEDAKLGEGKKSVAYHLTFASKERTLTAEEVDAAMNNIRKMLKERFDAEAR